MRQKSPNGVLSYDQNLVFLAKWAREYSKLEISLWLGMQKNDDGKIIGLKCKACIEFEKEISDMTMFKIHVFMFFVHYNRRSILCPFKIILGSIEVVPVCLLRAHSSVGVSRPPFLEALPPPFWLYLPLFKKNFPGPMEFCSFPLLSQKFSSPHPFYQIFSDNPNLLIYPMFMFTSS